MNYFFPSYYHTFQCIGKDCPDTCCGGWNIAIDKKSLARYRQILTRPSHASRPQSRAFLRRLRKSIDFRRRTIRLSERYCPLLTKDKLCGMYLHLGKDSLCNACRIYPRHQEEFGNVREISLSLSCPQAARILLGQKAKPRMILRKTQGKCPKSQQVDEKLLAWLMDSREVVFNILWEKNCPLEISAAMALAFCHDLQRRHDQRRFYQKGRFDSQAASQDLKRLAEKYLSQEGPKRFSRRLQTLLSRRPAKTPTDMLQSCFLPLLELYSTLEPVVGDWPKLMGLCLDSCRPFSMPSRPILPGNGSGGDSGNGGSSAPRFPSPTPGSRTWERQLLSYFVQTYFLGSIYDDDLFGKMQFAVASWLMVSMLANALEKESQSPSSCHGQKSSSPNPEDFDAPFRIQAAYLYSRQVENSDRNLNTLFQGFREYKALAPTPFLSALYFNASMAAFT